jgi:CheY-like chemotaxis protein
MSSMKALVVDDSKVGRLTMQKKLEAFGVEVDLAESGLQALEYLERRRPDVIFMDHMMPDLDGFETTRRIKASPATRDIPVVIISGADDQDFVRAARAIGALDAIAKPPADDAIGRVLRSLPQTVATTDAVSSTTAQPTASVAARPDQASVQAMIDTGIGQAIERLRGDWLDELRTRLEAAFENERQLQRTWTSRMERRLDQDTARLAEIAGVAETLRQRIDALEARLQALESVGADQTPAWLEVVDRHLDARLAALREGAERQAVVLGELRQEVVQSMDERHARQEQYGRELAGRIEALTEAMQQRLSALEATSPLPEPDRTSMLETLEASLGGRLTDMLREREAAIEAELERLRDQVQTLGQSQDALHTVLSAQCEGLATALEERYARMRAELETALRPAAAGPVQEGQAIVTLPSAAVEELKARLVQRLDEEWNGRWQAELQRLQRKVKTLTLVSAVGGLALLAALILLAS